MKSLYEVMDADVCHPGPPSRKDFLPQVLESCQKTTFSLGMFGGGGALVPGASLKAVSFLKVAHVQ